MLQTIRHRTLTAHHVPPHLCSTGDAQCNVCRLCCITNVKWQLSKTFLHRIIAFFLQMPVKFLLLFLTKCLFLLKINCHKVANQTYLWDLPHFSQFFPPNHSVLPLGRGFYVCLFTALAIDNQCWLEYFINTLQWLYCVQVIYIVTNGRFKWLMSDMLLTYSTKMLTKLQYLTRMMRKVRGLGFLCL